MIEKIYLGGGCFWCTESVFKGVQQVLNVVSGYSGGEIENPSYEDICTGKTGHAEVVEVTFDNEKIELKNILKIFFASHDPTTLNRQGADVGTQYRSVIFYSDENQRKIASDVIQELDQKKLFDGKIVTQLERFKAFYRAEEYHQNYFEKNPDQAYCQFVILPKLAKFRKNLDKFM